MYSMTEKEKYKNAKILSIFFSLVISLLNVSKHDSEVFSTDC